MGFFGGDDDYEPSPSPQPEIKVCHTCGHTFDAYTGRSIESSFRPFWYCKEHSPKYDGIDGSDVRRGVVYYRNKVECDENGVIKPEAINPK